MNQADRGARLLYGLEEDAIQVLEAVAERLRIGQKRHGLLDIDNDNRRWLDEALDEYLDGAVYMAAETIRLRRKGNGSG